MGSFTVRDSNILGTALGCFSLLVTSWRVAYRASRHRLWYDDYLALAAVIFSIFPWALVWPIFAPQVGGPSQHARVVYTYILEVTFTLAIWTARLSILWTIVRLAANKQFKLALYAVAGSFVTFALVLSGQKFWVCVPQKDWTSTPGGFCNFGKQVAITEIVTDVIGDALLIAIPIRMLWRLQITQALRIRLFCVFSMSLLSTTASLAQNYYQIHDGGVKDFIVSHVELQTAVTVCNLSVVTTAFYRWRYRKNIEEEEGGSSGRQGISRSIVTIGSKRNNKTTVPTIADGVHVETEIHSLSDDDLKGFSNRSGDNHPVGTYTYGGGSEYELERKPNGGYM